MSRNQCGVLDSCFDEFVRLHGEKRIADGPGDDILAVFDLTGGLQHSTHMRKQKDGVRGRGCNHTVVGSMHVHPSSAEHVSGYVSTVTILGASACMQKHGKCYRAVMPQACV